jgi:hypothetical protein
MEREGGGGAGPLGVCAIAWPAARRSRPLAGLWVAGRRLDFDVRMEVAGVAGYGPAMRADFHEISACIFTQGILLDRFSCESYGRAVICSSIL